ncbi:uncharacterized protein F4822DRAFT_399111 [Hypoxylon trugodes]|uniref:uncharacterized protein n=1 Tax=Hypoxylon trugodes TaxID=326681 RepID=UPI00219B3F46|nr:uncharacterized protein F4822DRAFT_399111 [Hypoxylon trugodes]KAI1389652.1 hypothetical protein F4822DRAFT_399111 [Hypoxylon trugodes]
MAGFDNILFQLKLIKERDSTSQDSDILNVFAYANPDEAAWQLDWWCPTLTEAKKAQDYLWNVWELLTDAARSPDATSEIQEQLVKILQSLVQIGKGYVPISNGTQRVWRDLPLLPQCIESCFQDPMSEAAEFTPESAKIWRNINSFTARCTGAGVLNPSLQVTYALRSALEEGLNTDPQNLERAECRMQVACEWIAHSAKPLLWWARENIDLSPEAAYEDRSQHVRRGELYEGTPAVCPERWGFWKIRFGELGKHPGFSEEIRKQASEAAENMAAAER